MIQSKCYRCGTELPDGLQFCGKCGTRLIPDTFDSLVSRLLSIEAHLKEQQDKIASDQRLVELETVDSIEKRAWHKVRNGFLPVTISVGILLFVLAAITGKSILNLRDAAAEARQSLDQTIAKSRSEVAKMSSQIDSMKPRLERLQSAVDQLGNSLQKSQSNVEQLQNKFEAVRGEKTMQAFTKIYPIFGERIVGTSETYISCQQKKRNDIYLDVMLSEPSGNTRFLDLQKVAKATDTLVDNGFTIFRGPVSLYTSSGISSQGLYGFVETSCIEFARTSAPCVYYFRKDFPVAKLKPILESIQPMAQDHFKYVSPTLLPDLPRQLIEKSCLDAIVVLGK